VIREDFLASSGVPSLDKLLVEGYPDRSAVLIVGSPGIGKEALGYWFIQTGLIQEDYCLYVTHRRVNDVLRDMKGFGISSERVPEWMASSEAAKKCDLRDMTSISFNIKQAFLQNKNRRIRIVTDILSPLLVMNHAESMYHYWSQLLDDLKQYDFVMLATMEEGMHTATTITSMEQLFDCVIQLRLYEEGLSVLPLLRFRKILGKAPAHGYFRFSFSRESMEVTTFVA